MCVLGAGLFPLDVLHVIARVMVKHQVQFYLSYFCKFCKKTIFKMYVVWKSRYRLPLPTYFPKSLNLAKPKSHQ